MTSIHVTASREYDVLVQPGLLDDAGAQIARTLGVGRTAAVVAGETVAGLYAARLEASLTRAGFRVVTFTYPGGEHCKTLATYAALLDFLAAHRLSRSDLIVALGGGVTGDLAGFAAATYQRGIPFVQVPTTLLAAVDSSVGGKTAVNLPSGKNQVGCFYQPSLVLCDPDTLQTLPPEEYRNGCAEVIKYAVLRSAPFFDELRAQPVSAQVGHVIATCVGMKRDLVAADEFDLKYRDSIDRESAYEIITAANEELERQRVEAEEAAAAEKQRLKDEAAAEKQRQKEEAAAEKARLKEEAAAEKLRLKEEAAAEKARLKEEAAAEKAREKEAAAKKKVAQRAVTNAASSVASSLSTNLVNSVLGGRQKSASAIAGQAAKSALSSVARSGSTAIIRGLFGTKK